MTNILQHDYGPINESHHISTSTSMSELGDDPKVIQPDVSIFQMLAADSNPQQHQDERELALMLVDANWRLFAISPSAAQLLNIPADSVRGQAVYQVAGGILEPIALRPNAIMTTTVFEVGDKTIFTNTRTLFDRNKQFLGWVVSLHEDLCEALSEFRNHHNVTTPVISTLQYQIQNMQELIAMLPKFSHHRYWHYLLMQHIERLTSEMARQVQRLTPPSA